MPYEIEKRGSKWVLFNKDTKKVYGRHLTKKAAESQRRLIGGATHGMVLRGKK